MLRFVTLPSLASSNKNSASIFSKGSSFSNGFAQRSFTVRPSVSLFSPVAKKTALLRAVEWKKEGTNQLVQWKKMSSSSTKLVKGEKDVYQKEYFHYSSIGLAALLPVSLLLSPWSVNFPVDVTLGVLFPLHGYLGMKLVIADYLPAQPMNNVANTVLLIITLLVGVGLFRLNWNGPGITESLKLLWKKPQTSIHKD